jgi:hypothetical protein
MMPMSGRANAPDEGSAIRAVAVADQDSSQPQASVS